ncbi:ABC transporter permease [Halorussus halophilus]|uniref:ABC transporter permease n=1 Tax=Halorussus halophilus TaxID=2650975 RepID=UPI0013017477|nr:ABC transporter permease [Halorussus halophilus]
MSRTRYIAYRLTWTVTGVWAVLTGLFLSFALTPDPNQFQLGMDRGAYRALRNYDQPLHERYFTWMESFLTLDLGNTLYGEPILGLLADASTVTLTYLVPSIAIAVVFGVLLGVFAAKYRDSVALRALRGLSYVGFAIPTIVAADVLFIFVVDYLEWYNFSYETELALFTGRNLGAITLPALVLAVNMVAIQLRYARSESVEILREDFIRTLRANGAGTRSIVTHVVRNAASSLLSLFFSEMVGVMFVVVVVIEVIFGIPGFGSLLYDAIRSRDIGLILATTIFPICFVMLGNLAQDIAYTILDPRIEGGESG